MNAPAFASLLPGHTMLIADSGNNRIIEVDSGDNVIFQ